MNQWAALALSILLIGDQPEPPSAPTPCHLLQKIAIGCLDTADLAATNASNLFDDYGFDKSRLEADFTAQYLKQYQCGVFHDDGRVPETIIVMRRGKIASSDGWHPVARVLFTYKQGVRIVWMAEGYLDPKCPTLGETGPYPEPQF